MTDTQWNEQIGHAVDTAFLTKPPLRLNALRYQLKNQIKALRTQYLKAGEKTTHQPWEEWLCDNYYVLERESKQTLRDIRRIEKKSAAQQLGLLYTAVRKVVLDTQAPMNDETVSALLGAVARHQPVSERQFSFLPVALKAAFIELAWISCTQEGSADGMSRAVTGLIRLGAVDFDEIIESSSGVEAVLLQDPAGVYPAMSGESRRYYRHLVAKLSARTGRAEQQVAQELLRQCQTARQDTPQAHIGYPLLHAPQLLRSRKLRGRWALGLGAALPLLGAVMLGLACERVWVGVLIFLPIWEILRTPIQHLATAGLETDFIPRMNLKKVENRPKTVVLVSTLLPKASEAPNLRKRLEQLYYSNSDQSLYYCVLADLGEWQFPADEKDESQIIATRRVIEELNAEHGERFLLFLRARTYNKTQNRYSGWERKRGAITEFVRFVKGESVSLHTFVGDRSVVADFRYIIALDADTSLLYESAQTLISAAIHPLNRPSWDENGVVTQGYGILAPKISADLESARQTAFSRVMTGLGGVTAYDTKDKDFYQDLFGEGIFAGKGLIDIDCFHALLSERFPENQILSHDILEGAYLRAGFVSDAEMGDGSPRGMLSWLARLHRWMRGDWQNTLFLSRQYKGVDGNRYQNPISGLSRFKLFDNLRRSITPVAALACLVAAAFTQGQTALILALCGVLAVTFASLWSAAWALLTGGVFTLSRKFFTRTLPHTLELIAQGALMLVMLPAQAFVTLDAVLRSLWRTFISRKNMLQWQTAAQSDSRSTGIGAVVKRFWAAQLFGICYLFVTAGSPLCLLGVVFSLIIPVAWLTARSTTEEGHVLSVRQRDTLISYNAAMWRYYEDFCNAKNHFLPPDNIQQSPVFRVATRTSPTNIGMMLLSVLAARDFDLIDSHGLYVRVERTLSSVEKLRKWHGNLYNWYDTETTDTLKPEFVSTVDSGNFVCCLVALSQGLLEYAVELPALRELAARIDKMVAETDLTVFYNPKKHLFSIGYDVDAAELVGSHYDFLMSEARLTSYYAVARKTVGKRHWGTLSRTMSRWGSYAGAVSWTGTMFEYFMPHLLLPVYEGSLLSEALTYCLYCHKKRVKGMELPWGISESAFYAFDNNLNYQYKAHGVQKLGVKRHLDKELVISPYSTFITIPMNPNSSMENLKRLQDLGVYGRYGFYEAVDFTAERVGKGALAVTRSYMAHHIGMSMVASVNALLDNRMQKRFMRDPYMRSAKEFLQEKIAKNTVVYDDLSAAGDRGEKHERPAIHTEENSVIHPCAPRCAVITNGELTDILTDTGANYLKFGDIDLTRRSNDLLRRPQGVFALLRAGDQTIPATMAPFYDFHTAYRIEYTEQAVTYYAERGDWEMGLRCTVHPTISCQQRQLVVQNNSNKKQLVQALFYLEPILCAWQDYNAHPAYSKLFVTAAWDADSHTLTFSRRNRDSTVDMYLTVGFLQDIDFVFETRREALMRSDRGMQDLWRFDEKEFSGEAGGVPDACCALRFDLLVGAGGQAQATLLICAARSKNEGIAGIISMRSIGNLDVRSAAKSPLLGESLEGRLGCALLGQLLFAQDGAAAGDLSARSRNRLGQSALWGNGISGDLPIAMLELSDGFDKAILQSYLRLHRTLRNLQVEFDLCVVYAGSQDEALRGEILKLIEKNSVGGLLGSRGGVFLLERKTLAEETYTLLRAVARHITTGTPPGLSQVALTPFRPAEIHPITPAPLPPNGEYVVEGGVFLEGRFYVDKKSPLPWSHVLANPQFGTLVSDGALGYTWAINSRENKLTPWYNDICHDNDGEQLLLFDGERIVDLVRGARASFSETDARYAGKHSTGLLTNVRVTVSGRGCAKYVDLLLENSGAQERLLECAYYTEPVLGVTRETARYIRPEVMERGEILLLENPYNTAVRCCSALTVRGEVEEQRFTTNRAAFLAGDWAGGKVGAGDDPCAAVITQLRVPANETVKLRFVLGYGMTPASAMQMVEKDLPELQMTAPNRIRIKTPREGINQYINHFAQQQMLYPRIRGRAAFYQCGGAYGFRDQLQDACGYALLDPGVLYRQIIRCCGVQFEEGDVLHWWHPLPENAGGLRGVRTRFSDDLLWLPLSVAEYIAQTGDQGILEVDVRYLSAPELAVGQQEQYLAPQRSALSETVYQHCLRALERSCRLDERGIPLIGCGDWNDGFSAVGAEGKGSSVWLALFMVIVLERFAPLCKLQGDPARADGYRARANALREAVDAHCWDGSWYLRAFFDSGEPMGSRGNAECAIDLLPQAFAVFAAMPDRERVQTALRSVLERLLDRRLGLVRLFSPPFQHAAQQPGYVKAYPSGLRENGGQYTHSAIWLAIALLEAGMEEEGAELLNLLCPAERARDPELAAAYKLEPYSIAADIYANPHAPGRGGWSLYTGAAAWYYRAVIEHLLGLHKRGKRLYFTPHLPPSWPNAEMQLDMEGTGIQVTIQRGQMPGMLCDGAVVDSVLLDGRSHQVVMTVR